MISLAMRAESAQAQASGTRARRRPVSTPERRAEQPDEAPGGHLPGGVGALSEHEVRGEHPDRPDGEAGQRPEREADDEGDGGYGLDVGQSDEGVTPERGDGGERGDDGDHPRGRAGGARRAASRPRARGRRAGTRRAANSWNALHEALGPGIAACGSRERGGEQRGALLGQQHPGAGAEDAGGFGGEVPAAGEQLARRPVGDHPPIGKEHAARGAGGGELGVVRGDDHRLTGLGARSEVGRERGLGLAVHAARGLIERQHGGLAAGLRAPVAGDDCERQALALAA